MHFFIEHEDKFVGALFVAGVASFVTFSLLFQFFPTNFLMIFSSLFLSFVVSLCFFFFRVCVCIENDFVLFFSHFGKAKHFNLGN